MSTKNNQRRSRPDVCSPSSKRSRVSSFPLIFSSPGPRLFFEEFSSALTTTADALLHKEIPLKILALDALQKNFPAFHALERPNFLALARGAEEEKKAAELEIIEKSKKIEENKAIAASTPLVRAEILQLLKHASQLKLRVQLNVPEADEGNNFGVEIQEEAISELARVEEISYSMLEKFLTYAASRARISAKILKFPLIEDWWLGLDELDKQEALELRLNMAEIRNSYHVLYDLLIKNQERIEDPRGSKHQNMQNTL